jgi:Fe-S oxidoreductase, related to NifB/MoaA family
VKASARLVAVTGEAAYPVIDEACRFLERVRGLSCRALLVKNRFFGPRVSVAGLLTGQDIARTYLAAVGRGGCDAVIVPSVSLKADEPRFLDDMTVGELERLCGAPVDVVEPTPPPSRRVR